MKYELTTNTKTYLDRTLYQIKALKDFGRVKAGDLGGWVESEDNLSQEGDCWITDSVKVYGNALVYGSAWVYGNDVLVGERDKKEEPKEEKRDNVNSPAHYGTGKIECIDYIEDFLTEEEYIGYLRGNIAKYLHRVAVGMFLLFTAEVLLADTPENCNTFRDSYVIPVTMARDQGMPPDWIVEELRIIGWSEERAYNLVSTIYVLHADSDLEEVVESFMNWCLGEDT